MAHGLPDFYRGVDIAYQALSELINRPKYGGCKRSTGTMIVTANANNTLFSLSGKGMIYGGLVQTSYSASQKDALIVFYIDGALILNEKLAHLNTNVIDKPRSYPLVLNKYDDTNFIYAVTFSYGITFETSILLIYQENDGGTPAVGYKIFYALI